MSGKSTAWLLTAAFAQLTCLQAQAATKIDKKADGGLEITACEPGMKDGERVAFKVGNKESIAQTVTVKNGCAVKTYSAGVVSPGSKIIIEFAGKTIEALSPIGGHQTPPSRPEPQPSRPTPTPLPAPQPSRPAPAPQPMPQLKTADLTQVRSNARDDARRFVNVVVRVFGQVENVRYNLFQGARNAELLVQAGGARIEDTADFAQGMSLASQDQRGLTRGLDAGRATGRQVGGSMGANAAQTRFATAAETETQPNLAPGMIDTSFAGLHSDMGPVRSIDARISDFDSRVQKDMRGQIIFGDGIVLGDDFYIRVLRAEIILGRDYRDDLLLDGWRGENAFDAWLNQRLSTKFSGDIQYFRSISDSSVYANAYDARKNFVNAFVEEYDRVLSDQWNRAVTKRNEAAFQMGQMLFIEARSGFARDLGYKHTYDIQYQSASVRGYQETVMPAYSQGFDMTVRQYQQSSVIGDVQVSVIDSFTGNPHEVALLDLLDVAVAKITNQGMKPADLTVRVTGSGVRELAPGGLVHVPGIKSTTNQRLTGLAQVVDAAPNAGLRLSILVGDRQIMQNVIVSWPLTLRKLAYAQGDDKRFLAQYVVSQLAKEYKDVAGMGNAFASADNRTLIQQLSIAFKMMTPAERQVVKALAVDIRRGYGSRPWPIDPRRDDYDTIMSILGEMGF
jgi:hypothetical protein